MLKKSRNYCSVLYPQEDESHAKALDYIMSHFQSCSIVHDKDIDENGELKKSHVHVVFCFKNARSINSVANELGIQANYLEQVSDLNSYLLYLIHYDEGGKFQYSIDDVKGSFKNKLERLIKNQRIIDEDDAVIFIKDFITKSSSILTTDDLVTFCCSNGVYSHLRRSSYIFKSLLTEHNTFISNNPKDDVELYKYNLDTGELTEVKEGEINENIKL